MRKRLAPRPIEAFKAFSQSVFAEGALDVKCKQLIAVAVAHVTQCPYCIRSHTKLALQHGATQEQIMEAIWVAAEMRAGGVLPTPSWRWTQSRRLNTKIPNRRCSHDSSKNRAARSVATGCPRTWTSSRRRGRRVQHVV